MFRYRRRSDDDFFDEIQAHIDLEADRLMEEEGLSPTQAMAAAHRAFGNVTHSRERFYESSRWVWFEHLLRDVKSSFRWMRRLPTSTAAIVLSLALGIGASTSIFSLADQALVRSLPVAEPDDLVQLHWSGRFVGGGRGFGSLQPHPLFRDLRAEQDLFADVFARYQEEAILGISDRAEPVSVEIVSGSYFPALGVRPALGRLFTTADDVREGGHPLVVLSSAYWRRRFGADSAVIGRTLRINDFPFTVIGVAEDGFYGMDWSLAADVWVPLMMNGVILTRDRLNDRREAFLHVFARLRPGITAEQAEARLQPWFGNYLRADMEREGWPVLSERQLDQYLGSRLELRPGHQGQAAMDSDIRQPMFILAVATTLCLLLACLNVANLTLARTLARRPTIALRSALGATRTRIVTGQIIESGTLAIVGAAFGAWLAPWISRGVLSFFPDTGAATIGLDPSVDLRALGMAFGLALFATVISAAAPAYHAARVRPITALRQESGRITGGVGSRRVLVVLQFALALVLLVGAGLFARTLGTLRDSGPGFSTSNLMMFRVAPVRVGYDMPAARQALASVQEALDGSPDIERTGFTAFEMLLAGSWNNFLTVQGRERVVTEMSVPMNAISPGFFSSIGAPIVAGRNFDSRDQRNGDRFALTRAIVNEEFAARYLDGVDPIGAQVGFGNGPDVNTPITIIGVVQTFHVRGLREPEPQIYFSAGERPMGEATFYVRARTSSASAARAIDNAVIGVDPRLAVQSLRTIDNQLDRMLTAERMLATAAVGFAVVATLLAMIGLYGLLAFTAAMREKEMGIRIALGAPRAAAGGLIVQEAIRLVVIGTVIALPVVWALGRLVESQLFGVRPMDPLTITLAAAVLAAVCVLASVMPARKAASVSPVEALRSG